MKAKMRDVNGSMQHRQDKDKKKLVPNVQSSGKVDTKGKAKLVEPNDDWQIPKETAKSCAPLASRNYVPALEGKGDAHLASSSHNKTLVETWDRVVHSYKGALLNSAAGSSFMRIPPSQERHADSHLLTVICAFGRLGTMFGCEKYNIKPDLVTVAKALSSGYMPIGAVLMGPHIAEVVSSQSNQMGSFGHGFTYSGHPVPCAVALEALKIYKERNIVDHVNSLSPYFQEGMREAIAESPVIGEVRGTGLIMGVEFTRNKSPTDLFPESWATGTYFGKQCAEQGLLVRVAGDTIMMSPPLISTKEEIQKLISMFKESVKRTEQRIVDLESKK
ncbi:hypothetical protein L7F22_060850 [Adiantum nelumboides]|nr:hypothetical protein [Adiantum nelumboides]